jgi:manganese efflux pump family protein
MELFTVVFIAVGLAMDCFAVSIGVGACPHSEGRRAKLRLAFHFGFFQGAMTLLGWLAGSTVAGLIGQIDHWIALVLLGYVGINMIRSGLSHKEEAYPCDPSRGRTMVMLSVATSIDAMAVGLSVGMLKVDVVYPAMLIGLVTFGLSMVGLLAGNRLGERFGKRMEVIGGVILNGIGLRILLTHLA